MLMVSPVDDMAGDFLKFFMARINITYRQLFELSNDINLQAKNSPAFAFFNKGRIERFRRENAMQLKILESRINELARNNALHDEHGVPVIENDEYRFLTPETKQAYLDGINSFFKQQTFIIE
jgi:hypothetical protein